MKRKFYLHSAGAGVLRTDPPPVHFIFRSLALGSVSTYAAAADSVYSLEPSAPLKVERAP